MKNKFLIATMSFALLVAGFGFLSNGDAQPAKADGEAEDLSNTYVLVEKIEEDWEGKYVAGYDDGTTIKLLWPGVVNEVNRSYNYIEIPSDGTGKITKTEEIEKKCELTVKNNPASGYVPNRRVAYIPDYNSSYKNYVLRGMKTKTGGPDINAMYHTVSDSSDMNYFKNGCIFNPGKDKTLSGIPATGIAFRLGQGDNSAESELRFNDSTQSQDSQSYNRFMFYGNSVTGHADKRARLYKLGGVNPKATPESITVDTQGLQTTYALGESFVNPTSVIVNFDNGTTKGLSGSLSDLTYTGIDFSSEGEKTVTVKLNKLDGVTVSLQTTYTVTVGPKKIQRVNMLADSSRTTFFVGEEYVLPSFKVTYTGATSVVPASTLTPSSDGYPTYMEPDMSTPGEKTVTFTFVDPEYPDNVKTYNHKFTVKEDTIQSISISEQPKVSFYVGDEFVFNGKVQANYDSGKTVDITDQIQVGQVDMTVAGAPTVTLTYGDFSTNYVIEVNEVLLDRYELTSQPTKLQYYVGDQLDSTGLEVTAIYNSGKTENVSSSATLECDPLTSAGTKTVTVKVGQNSVGTFQIEVAAVVVTKIEFVTEPTKTITVSGEYIFDGTVKATYNNGTTKDVTGEVTVSNLDVTQTGKVTVTVTYEGETLTYELEVKAAPSGGCGGNIVATSAILSSISLIGVILLVVRRRKHA